MRKGIWSAAAVVGLLSAASVFVIGPGVRAADTKVTMKDQLIFEPADITVPVGGSVVWHNDGGIQHDAKAEDGSFSIPMVDPGKDSQPVSFKTPGDFQYYCTVPGHKSAGMVGTVHVGAASTTPTTVAPTTTTQPAGGATTTTAPGQTTTTTRAGASGAGQSTTTTTAPAAGGATSTTLAPAATPTSAPESAGGSAAANAAAPGSEEAAADSSEGAQDHKKVKNSPIGIAFAAVSTLLLVGIAGKLLASKP